METFGYPAKTWIAALDLQAHDPRLDELLGQISTEEIGHGRGMLSVLVVHKTGDQRPGREQLGKKLG